MRTSFYPIEADLTFDEMQRLFGGYASMITKGSFPKDCVDCRGGGLVFCGPCEGTGMIEWKEDCGTCVLGKIACKKCLQKLEEKTRGSSGVFGGFAPSYSGGFAPMPPSPMKNSGPPVRQGQVPFAFQQSPQIGGNQRKYNF